MLERTWHDRHRDFNLLVHAKFNSGDLDGLNIMSYLSSGAKVKGCQISSFKIYRVSDSDFTESLVYTASPTMDSGKFYADVTQSNLGLNELSGAETYSILVEAVRKRKTYTQKIWFNHLGCFDSLFRLKKQTQRLEIVKADL